MNLYLTNLLYFYEPRYKYLDTGHKYNFYLDE
jgi:hypothetical protein